MHATARGHVNDGERVTWDDDDAGEAGDLSIAYQVIGRGDVDVILVPQWLSNIEQYWEHPAAAYFLRRIASFSRLIIFDKRGTGLSDPVPSTQTLEERMDDVLAVMDAVGSERAVLLGTSEGGPMAALFAATYPDRCISLILVGACARRLRSEDYPEGRPREVAEAYGRIWLEDRSDHPRAHRVALEPPPPATEAVVSTVPRAICCALAAVDAARALEVEIRAGLQPGSASSRATISPA